MALNNLAFAGTAVNCQLINNSAETSEIPNYGWMVYHDSGVSPANPIEVLGHNTSKVWLRDFHARLASSATVGSSTGSGTKHKNVLESATVAGAVAGAVAKKKKKKKKKKK